MLTCIMSKNFQRRDFSEHLKHSEFKFLRITCINFYRATPLNNYTRIMHKIQFHSSLDIVMMGEKLQTLFHC